MIGFAKQVFAQSKQVGKSGASEAAHMRQLAKSKGLDAPPLPYLDEEQRWLWETFMDLSRARTSGLVPHPITFTEIDAWQRVREVRLEQWEVDAIGALDDAFLAEMTRDLGKDKAKSQEQ